MSEYNIRFANYDDIPQIMQFIDEHWKKDHILAKNKPLFEWQYMNDNGLNMVIGEDENQVIHAILGYITYSDGDDKDFSLALWRAREGTVFLGVKVLMFLLKEEPHRHVFCNGINMDTTVSVYRRMGFKIGRLKQWYRLRDMQEYRIAKVDNKVIPQVKRGTNIELIKIGDFDELKKNASEKLFDASKIPYKSGLYIYKRYFKHPIYKYDIWGVRNFEETIDAVIVFRVEECNQSKALRIIDIVGEHNLIYDITSQIDNIAQEYGVEYVDIYENGLDDNYLIEAGWRLIGIDKNIIPNYFSPYIPCNIDINICTTEENIILFKGDGDQDRPN